MLHSALGLQLAGIILVTKDKRRNYMIKTSVSTVFHKMVITLVIVTTAEENLYSNNQVRILGAKKLRTKSLTQFIQ